MGGDVLAEEAQEARSEHHTKCLWAAQMILSNGGRVREHSEFYQDFDIYYKIARAKLKFIAPTMTYPQLQRLRMLQEKCLLINNPAGRPTPLDLMDVTCETMGTTDIVPRPEGTTLRHVLHEALFWIEELVDCPDPAAPWNQ